jgi:DNA repair exonuclease SbcCD ATPase subunit
MWRLQTPPSRPTIVLDEPFKHLSQDLRPKAAEMLKEISSKLGLQIIMVTHDVDLVEAADRLFLVSQRNGISKVVVGGGREKAPVAAVAQAPKKRTRAN